MDVVQSQLLLASGKSFAEIPGLATQEGIGIRNYALQTRVTMMPGGGQELLEYQEPAGENIRVDSAGFYKGLKPNQMYDPLVGKLICKAPAFADAHKLCLDALRNFHIRGVNNNLEALERILKHPEFIANDVNTDFLVKHPELLNLAQAVVGAKGTGGPPPKKKKAVSLKKAEPTWSETKQLAVEAPLNGNVLQIKKTVGAEVDVGETVVVMSAMKLETEILSPVKGKVIGIKCAEGDQVNTGQVLVEVEGKELIVAEEGEEEVGPYHPLRRILHDNSPRRQEQNSAMLNVTPHLLWTEHRINRFSLHLRYSSPHRPTSTPSNSSHDLCQMISR